MRELLETKLGFGRCVSQPRRQLKNGHTTEVPGERVTFRVSAEGLRNFGQHKIEHVPGSGTSSRLIHEVCVILAVGAVPNTMVDVVICRYLDTEHLSKSLDSEVGHRE